VKLKKHFDWYQILGDQAWTAKEIARKLNMHVNTCRRYLRIGEASGRLVVFTRGRYKLYVAREAWEKYLEEHPELLEQYKPKKLPRKKPVRLLFRPVRA